MERYDLIVIGAGISGLSLAHYCQRAGLKTLVIERSERIGGCFNSHSFSGDAAGFWLELGAHTCYNSYGNLIGIMEQCALLDRILAREKVSFRMLVDSGIKSIPSQLSFLELFASVWHIFTQEKKGASVASYYATIVGKKNFDRVFAPAFNAVVSQRANDVPADMLFKKRPRRKDILKSYTLVGGLQTITDTIARNPGITTMTGTDVTGITFDGSSYRLTTADGTTFEATTLALATPPPEASRLLQGVAPELSPFLARIPCETIETVGVAVQKDALRIAPLAGIIAVNDIFYSAVSRDTVPHESQRGFSFHFKAGTADQEGKLRRISEVLGVKRETLRHVATQENRLPSPVVGHGEITDGIDRLIAGRRLLVTGNYFAGMAIEDCVSRSRSEFERLTAMGYR
ncbi:MAG: amine oxidase [Geobacter sp.]|nr:MAG: amine oxidase [Geobacter sp.]